MAIDEIWPAGHQGELLAGYITNPMGVCQTDLQRLILFLENRSLFHFINPLGCGTSEDDLISYF